MASNRRAALATLCGLGAASAFGALSRPLQAAFADPLRLPQGPLRLERRLIRTLGERAALTVTRSWVVRFERQGRVIMVAGAQLVAVVDAPPHLSELARIEEQRDASGLFPIMLSEAGLIVSSPGLPGANSEVSAAARVAEAMIARQPGPDDARARSRHYLAVIHQAGSALFDTLPGDLFFPAGVSFEQGETVELPDGSSGRFSLAYAAHAQADAPWLKGAERRVTTSIAGLDRSSVEYWTLGAM